MKWLIKNLKIIKLLLLAMLFVLAFALGFNGIRGITLFLICLAAYGIPILVLTFLPRIHLQKIAREFENTCDPKEYAEVLTLHYKSNPKMIINQANYAVALMFDRSKLQEARMVMETLPLNKIYGNMFQFIVYNNFCSLYLDLDEIDKAEESYLKSLEFDAKIKKEASRLHNKHYIAINGCELAVKKNDIEKALSYLPFIKNDTLCSRCAYALSLAKIYLIQNETEKAKEQLEFVMKNANKTNMGQEAKELFEKIS